MMQFLLQYYDGVRTLPEQLFLSLPIDTAALHKYFLQTYGKSPETGLARGKRNRAIMNMAVENSKTVLEKQIRERGNLPALEELKAVLQLPKIPRRIEGFDISHLAGSHPVASMVSFLNGVPDKSRYRRFHIKKEAGAHDDYEAIREVTARRYTRVLNEQDEAPDLILIDGGKGQVSAARSILEALGFGSIPLLGLAKKHEEIFLPDREQPVLLPEGSPPLRVLQSVRDEAHRFATGFNKNLRKKDGSLSLLQSIRGIGPAKSRKIMEVFGSLGAAAAASREELQSKTGISSDAAGELYTKLSNLST
jgi:excinuclease ABC subunit C